MGIEERINSVDKASGTSLFGCETIYGYFTHIWFWRFRLHIFWCPEPSIMMHDHAWDFWSFPLGSYVERVYDPVTDEMRMNVVRALHLHWRPAEYTHKYMGKWAGKEFETETGAAITLAWRGGGHRNWKYWKVVNGKVKTWYWKDYLSVIENRWGKTR